MGSPPLASLALPPHLYMPFSFWPSFFSNCPPVFFFPQFRPSQSREDTLPSNPYSSLLPPAPLFPLLFHDSRPVEFFVRLIFFPNLSLSPLVDPFRLVS